MSTIDLPTPGPHIGDVPPAPPVARDARLDPLPPWCTSPMRAALSELMLSGALVLAEIDSVELQSSWKKKPATGRLLAALEQARMALS